jgi:hypothetical protein
MQHYRETKDALDAAIQAVRRLSDGPTVFTEHDRRVNQTCVALLNVVIQLTRLVGVSDGVDPDPVATPPVTTTQV